MPPLPIPQARYQWPSKSKEQVQTMMADIKQGAGDGGKRVEEMVASIRRFVIHRGREA